MIITPPWLADQQIQQSDKDGVDVSYSPYDRSYRFVIGKISWIVRENKLIIESRKNFNVGNLAAEVLLRLSHTPISAIGFNFTYLFGESEIKPEQRLPMGRLSFDKNPELKQIQSTATLMDGDCKVQITFTQPPGGDIEVLINRHHSTTATKHAEEFARQFDFEKTNALELLESTFDLNKE